MRSSVLDGDPGPTREPGPSGLNLRRALRRRLGRRTGTLAALAAVLGFAVGSYGAFRVVHGPAHPPILLRQATEPERMASYDNVPGSSGVLVLLRNDGATAIQVIDAAFARTSAAPPLYIAPETVSPGSEVNVFVAVPGRCFQGFDTSGPRRDPSTVQITVGAREAGGPVQFIPVQVSGELAQLVAGCLPRRGGG